MIRRVLIILATLLVLTGSASAITIPGRTLGPKSDLETSLRQARMIQAERGGYPKTAAIVRMLSRSQPSLRYVALGRDGSAPGREKVIGVWVGGPRSLTLSARLRDGTVLRLRDRAGRVSRNY